MGEECVICGKTGGCYLNSGSHRAGPYCPTHRWKLGIYVIERDKKTAQDRFDGYVEEFLNLKRGKKHDRY